MKSPVSLRRRSIAVAISLMGIAGLGVSNASAQPAVKVETATVTGAIQEVGVGRITIKAGPEKKTAVLQVTKETEILLNKHPATLGDLKPGDNAVITVPNGRPVLALKIVAARLIKTTPAPPIPRKVKLPPPGKAGLTQGGSLGVVVGPSPVGALVLDVRKLGPADRIGILRGDFIMQIDRRKIASAAGLVAVLRSRPPGKRVSVSYWRGGKEFTRDAVLASSRIIPDEARDSNRLDVLLDDELDIRHSLGLAVNRTENRRLLVASVVRGGPADAAGIHKGDVIVTVNGDPVSSTREFTKILTAMKPKGVAVVTFTREGVRKQTRVIVRKRPNGVTATTHEVRRPIVAGDAGAEKDASAAIQRLARQQAKLAEQVRLLTNEVRKLRKTGD